MYCAYLEQRYTNWFAYTESKKFEKLIEEDKIVVNSDVKTRLFKTARMKTCAAKASAN